MLHLHNLSKTYSGPRPVSAVKHASLMVEQGEFVALQGPSGCGKSTMLLIAGGLLRPDSGHVELAQTDVYSLNAERRARFRAQHIGFVFQQFHLLPYLTVLENVLAPSLTQPQAMQLQQRERAEELIARFGLESRAAHVPGQLSTGERQRAAFARAWLNRPSVILADEPTGNLDRKNADSVLESLAEFAAEGGAVLLVTHDDAAAGFADRVVRLEAGKVVSRFQAVEG